MKDVVSGAQFFKFENAGDQFDGIFENVVTREKEGDNGEPVGSIMGYLFRDKNGDSHIIGASHAIEKALTASDQGIGNAYRITFLGQTKNSKNQPVNRFRVQVYEGNEWAEFCGNTAEENPLA